IKYVLIYCMKRWYGSGKPRAGQKSAGYGYIGGHGMNSKSMRLKWLSHFPRLKYCENGMLFLNTSRKKTFPYFRAMTHVNFGSGQKIERGKLPRFTTDWEWRNMKLLKRLCGGNLMKDNRNGSEIGMIRI